MSAVFGCDSLTPKNSTRPQRTKSMGRDIDVLNEEMVAAGVRDFRGRAHSRPRGEVVAGAARWEGAHD